MNQYIVNEPQAKAINDGASLLIVEIDVDNKFSEYVGMQEIIKGTAFVFKNPNNLQTSSDTISFKQNDEIYIAEKFIADGRCIYYYSDKSKTMQNYMDWKPASEMTEQQSRFKRKAGEVSVKRVQDITHDEINLISCIKKPKVMSDGRSFYSDYIHMESLFDDWLENQDINYSANPWVALVELKKGK